MAIDIQRFQLQVEAVVYSSCFDRARYPTDVSTYHILPKSVLVPKTWVDVVAARFSRRSQIKDITKRDAISLFNMLNEKTYP